MNLKIHIPETDINLFCRQNHIKHLALFGSVLRDDFNVDSDIDILVELEPGTRVGLRFFGMEEELSRILGRKVDLNTSAFLSEDFRSQAISEAVTLYDDAA